MLEGSGALSYEPQPATGRDGFPETLLERDRSGRHSGTFHSKGNIWYWFNCEHERSEERPSARSPQRDPHTQARSQLPRCVYRDVLSVKRAITDPFYCGGTCKNDCKAQMNAQHKAVARIGLAPDWPWKELPDSKDMSEGSSLTYRSWRVENNLPVPETPVADPTAPTAQ
ncbi:hypothetical protein FPRO05_10753 [Fusarium proliferatum]|uniref:Uncharacterized protein n=1 Tax=Gibberella intermedia TaxID=948311 RepID=A0A365ND30_GIBIN|nr:hypothetical protein FPRO05_10753 [Fusarium proliferatum]